MVYIWITLCCKAIWSVERETENAYEISDLWSRSKKSNLEGIKWLKVESKSQAIYRIYKSYTLSDVSFKRSLKRRNVLWFSNFWR